MIIRHVSESHDCTCGCGNKAKYQYVIGGVVFYLAGKCLHKLSELVSE